MRTFLGQTAPVLSSAEDAKVPARLWPRLELKTMLSPTESKGSDIAVF